MSDKDHDKACDDDHDARGKRDRDCSGGRTDVAGCLQRGVEQPECERGRFDASVGRGYRSECMGRE